jgi:hypothetical protein
MKRIFSLICGFLLLVIFSGCSGGGSSANKPGSGNLAVNVNIDNQQAAGPRSLQQVAGPRSLQQVNRIASLQLTLLPLNPGSYTPSPIDLMPYYQNSNRTLTINNLTDNETYYVKIEARDAGNNVINYGSNSVVILPSVLNTVSVNAMATNGSVSQISSPTFTATAATINGLPVTDLSVSGSSISNAMVYSTSNTGNFNVVSADADNGSLVSFSSPKPLKNDGLHYDGSANDNLSNLRISGSGTYIGDTLKVVVVYTNPNGQPDIVYLNASVAGGSFAGKYVLKASNSDTFGLLDVDGTGKVTGTFKNIYAETYAIVGTLDAAGRLSVSVSGNGGEITAAGSVDTSGNITFPATTGGLKYAMTGFRVATAVDAKYQGIYETQIGSNFASEATFAADGSIVGTVVDIFGNTLAVNGYANNTGSFIAQFTSAGWNSIGVLSGDNDGNGKANCTRVMLINNQVDVLGFVTMKTTNPYAGIYEGTNSGTVFPPLGTGPSTGTWKFGIDAAGNAIGYSTSTNSNSGRTTTYALVGTVDIATGAITASGYLLNSTNTGYVQPAVNTSQGQIANGKVSGTWVGIPSTLGSGTLTGAKVGLYTQSDLTGTWHFQTIQTGGSNQWQRGTVTADASGFLTFLSFLDSAGNNIPPSPGTIQLTMNGSGVISESGVNGSAEVHMTMTSNKNFIAGTVTATGGHQLRILQKVLPGTVYQNGDLQNKSFVYHALTTGSVSTWSYGTGTIDASGMLTISSRTTSSGPVVPGQPTATSLDANGVFKIAVNPTMSGFLSDDKKTIVATQSDPGGTYHSFTVYQITGQTYTAGGPSISTSHWLAVGAAPAPFWAHYTLTIDSTGLGTPIDAVSSWPGFTIGAGSSSMNSSGTVTIAQAPSYHGQVSHDGKFIVATRTIGSGGAYVLAVTTK